jgi:lipopolysaccharide transport system ATP-binding protein
MKPIIEVRNLSKKYKIGERQRYLSLRDSVSNLFSSKNTEGPPFWALDDVSFDIQAGESVGIIGRNGAGKSTLLKILSRITPPTKGSVILRGRMASLLEVGTGFHSELTGRENVFMNGSILGLKKREIEAKFDEIVDFSGVEQFIDTPLKHYSSGMQLRLAFAVAAHLEPEILVIDEVLAVGDAEFQKRCLGKMDEVSRSGRTVLFVSHNLGAIESLCPNSLFLQFGKLKLNDTTKKVISAYSLSGNETLGKSLSMIPFEGSLKNLITFENLTINNKNPFQSNIILSPKNDFTIILFSNLYSSLKPFKVTLSFFVSGIRVFTLHDCRYPTASGSDRIKSTFVVPKGILRPATYSIALGAHEEGFKANWIWATDVCFFEILEEWDDKLDPINIGFINVDAFTQRENII